MDSNGIDIHVHGFVSHVKSPVIKMLNELHEHS